MRRKPVITSLVPVESEEDIHGLIDNSEEHSDEAGAGLAAVREESKKFYRRSLKNVEKEKGTLKRKWGAPKTGVKKFLDLEAGEETEEDEDSDDERSEIEDDAIVSATEKLVAVAEGLETVAQLLKDLVDGESPFKKAKVVIDDSDDSQ